MNNFRVIGLLLQPYKNAATPSKPVIEPVTEPVLEQEPEQNDFEYNNDDLNVNDFENENEDAKDAEDAEVAEGEEDGADPVTTTSEEFELMHDEEEEINYDLIQEYDRDNNKIKFMPPNAPFDTTVPGAEIINDEIEKKIKSLLGLELYILCKFAFFEKSKGLDMQKKFRKFSGKDLKQLDDALIKGCQEIFNKDIKVSNVMPPGATKPIIQETSKLNILIDYFYK